MSTVASQLCQEPHVVYAEEQFERALASMIQSHLGNHISSFVLPRFGLDFAIFVSHPGAPRALFLEAKSYGGQRQGGVGFGNGHSEGSQVDLLLYSPDQLAILDAHVRWAFANAMQRCGTTRYALLSCSQARDAAMGGVARGKQNNFRISALKSHCIDWPTLCEELLAFLSLQASAGAL